jgi:hypothetical protein
MHQTLVGRFERFFELRNFFMGGTTRHRKRKLYIFIDIGDDVRELVSFKQGFN